MDVRSENSDTVHARVQIAGRKFMGIIAGEPYSHDGSDFLNSSVVPSAVILPRHCGQVSQPTKTELRRPAGATAKIHIRPARRPTHPWLEKCCEIQLGKVGE